MTDGITTRVAAGGVVLLLAAAAGVGVWIFKPRSLDCASTEARELVSQIARENRATMDEIARQFIRENPPPQSPQAPKSPDRIAAEQRISALKEALAQANKNVAQANREWLDRVRAAGGPQGLSTIRSNTEASQRVTQATLELARAQASYDLRYGAEDRADRLQSDRADAANRATVLDSVQKEISYKLEDVRTTDKNLAGALSCAATLKGNAGKYSWTVPITYKVQQTSDGRLYVAVYGLKKS
jgi:hypothetical protein